MKPGSRWASAVDTTEVVVVRPPETPVTLECGGAPMVAHGSPKSGDAPSPDFSEGTLAGKRYFDEVSGLEVLCSKAGVGSLAIDGRPVLIKEAKQLPSSD